MRDMSDVPSLRQLQTGTAPAVPAASSLPDACDRCGYSLAGADASIRCPECGSAIPRGEWIGHGWALYQPAGMSRFSTRRVVTLIIAVCALGLALVVVPLTPLISVGLVMVAIMMLFHSMQ
jgi:hypothetical protein